ncbi:MAG: hypothetical protein SPK76_04930 [Bacteroidales bacterium]|nr:hypothetical protein [Bacteroidales bacterium]
MTVSNKAWQQYIKTLSAIDQTAARKFEVYVRGLDLGKYANRKKAIDYAVRLDASGRVFSRHRSITS